MQNFVNAPHRGETPRATATSPNAALLIDFDNVTMGIRSDLTSQLKELLNSDIIKGKVAVQRAYADWRRYAQYIVPLSEASVDLIFAPAYGSSKKNATDIRLAIDALELVFTRPEIGTYILLSGDSDFSSLVLKLKEYGKYVIGVGLRESASDLLVQNCDEYFSYSGLTGLTKAGEEDTVSEHDPWELVEAAVKRMADNNDVMRSDRLKQVMLDLDPNFDEGEIGYSKFNKFLTEAASRNKLALKKLDNGQYEVQPLANGGGAKPETRRQERDRRDDRARRSSSKPQSREPRREERQEPAKPTPKPKTKERRVEDLDHAYDLLRKAVSNLITENGEPARDSDIKRQILELEPGWDESELGFTKFTRFLRQAHDAEVIDLQRTSEGYYLARFPGQAVGQAPARSEQKEQKERGRDRDQRRDRGDRRSERAEAKQPEPESAPEPEPTPEPTPPEPIEDEAEEPEPQAAEAQPDVVEPEAVVEFTEEAEEAAEETVKQDEAPAPRAEAPKAEAPKAERKPSSYGRGMRRGKTADGPPPLLPGQVVGGKASGQTTPPAEPAAPAEPAKEEPAPETEPAAESAPEPEASSPAEAPATETAEATEPQGGEKVEVERTFDADDLGLPIEEGAVIRYLSNSYQGVGQKTAEALIEEFGADGVFNGLDAHPDRVKEILGAGRRTELLLEAWKRDFSRRKGAGENQPVGESV